MDNNGNEESGLQAKGEHLNTGSSSSENNEHTGEHTGHKKGGIHNNALYAASMGRAATAAVDPHDNSGLAQTGTNPGYEGPVGEGAGGSAGTGYTSGQSGAGAGTGTASDYEQTGLGGNGATDKARQQADDATDEEE